MSSWVEFILDLLQFKSTISIGIKFSKSFLNQSFSIGVDFTDYFEADLASLGDLEADGLLQREEAGLRVTPLGRLFIRIIAMRFDAYLQAEIRKGRYSQTV